MLTGTNILLRALEPEDVEVLYNWENNPENWPVSGTRAPYSRDLLSQYITNAHLDIYSNKQLRLIICKTQNTEAIGAIDLFEFDPFNQHAGVGILIGTQSERKKGYAKEAIEILKTYAKEHLDLHQLYCSVNVNNTNSLNLFKTVGFEITGEKRNWQKGKKGFENVYFLQCNL